MGINITGAVKVPQLILTLTLKNTVQVPQLSLILQYISYKEKFATSINCFEHRKCHFHQFHKDIHSAKNGKVHKKFETLHLAFKSDIVWVMSTNVNH
jgi:hypothetical protein